MLFSKVLFPSKIENHCCFHNVVLILFILLLNYANCFENKWCYMVHRKVRKEATNICNACLTPKSLWNLKIIFALYVYLCLFFKLTMENFKYIHKENNASSPHVPILQRQQLSAQGQSSFIYIPHPLNPQPLSRPQPPRLAWRPSIVVYHFICKYFDNVSLKDKGSKI